MEGLVDIMGSSRNWSCFILLFRPVCCSGHYSSYLHNKFRIA